MDVTRDEARALEDVWNRWVCLGIASALRPPTDAGAIVDAANVAVTWARAMGETLDALGIGYAVLPDDSIPETPPDGPELGRLMVLDLVADPG